MQPLLARSCVTPAPLAIPAEFSGLEVRPGEENAVSKLLMHAPVAVANHRATDPHAKANALLQVGRPAVCVLLRGGWR